MILVEASWMRYDSFGKNLSFFEHQCLCRSLNRLIVGISPVIVRQIHQDVEVSRPS